jgi:dihydroflavonol-4-reductase
MNNVPNKGLVLVTGATGFLGFHLVEALVKAGYRVRALVRQSSPLVHKRFGPGVEVVVGDILDAESIERAAQGCEGLFHAAGKVSRDPEATQAMREANVVAVERTFDAAKRAGVRKVVFASTSGIIGLSEDPDAVANEESPPPLALINRLPYYRSKYYGELAALARNSADFSVVCVNPSLLLGPGDLAGSSTEDVRRYLEQQLPVATAGGVSFVDARDAALGMIAAYERGLPGKRYLLTACNCSVFTFLSRVARVAGLAPPKVRLPANKQIKKATLWVASRLENWLGSDDSMPDRHSLEISQYYWYVDSSLAERELGWRPRDAMTTLADTVADLRDRGIVAYAPTLHPQI